ncbi:MAG: MFS transporter [Bacteroidota bacterium]
MNSKHTNPFNAVVVVASLGYFVDIYDLILFNVVKKSSLTALGVAENLIDQEGVMLFNLQMFGMLVGGLLWGILGDRRGRVKVLFGSILLYSAANIANAFVTDLTTYGAVRFLAGIGLAGELGAGITLVSENMSKEKRGLGTMILVTFGALGAVFAFVVSEFPGLTWQHSYMIGGGMGLLLLLIRMGTLESGMFKSMHHSTVKKGDFLSLFTSRERFFKYLNCILIGLPVWYVIGLLIALCVTFAKATGVTGEVSTGKAVMFAYIGLSVGDLISGLLSQFMKSRKKVVYIYLTLCAVLSATFLFVTGLSTSAFYTLCLLLGVGTGFWALFVSIASEQFGTNIRSTVTTTVPNFVRGSVWPITIGFQYLSPAVGVIAAASVVGVICIGLAFVATLSVKETFGKELDYVEG